MLGIAFTLHGQEDSEWETLSSLFNNCLERDKNICSWTSTYLEFNSESSRSGVWELVPPCWCFLEKCRGAAAAGEGSWRGRVAGPPLGHQSSCDSRNTVLCLSHCSVFTNSLHEPRVAPRRVLCSLVENGFAICVSAEP